MSLVRLQDTGKHTQLITSIYLKNGQVKQKSNIEINKMLISEIKEDVNSWRDLPCSCIRSQFSTKSSIGLMESLSKVQQNFCKLTQVYSKIYTERERS